MRRNMAVNWSPTRLKISCIAVEFPIKVEDIFKPSGGTEHDDVWESTYVYDVAARLKLLLWAAATERSGRCRAR